MRLICLLIPLLALTWACAQDAPAPAPAAPAPTPAEAINLRLILPPEIPAVPGREANLYYDNVILHPVSRTFLYDVACAKGQQQEERWTWTPKPEDVGSFPLTLRICDPAGVLLAEGQTTIHVYPADAGAGQPLSALVVGDSLTAATVYTDEIFNLMAAEGNPSLTLIGTSAPNKDKPGVRHEGYGGWTARGFATMWGAEPILNNRRARSPFLYEQDGKPVLNFQKYCDEQNGGKGPDVITILLGCNDNFGAKDDTIEASIDSFLTHMDILIAEFHKVRPDTKIGVVSLLPPAGTQDAFGNNYACGQTRWQYKKNQHRVMERVVEKYTGKAAENIFLVPAYVNLDCMHNYPTVEVLANARAEGPAAKVFRLANGVHPAAGGYRQLADSIYCWMKGQLAK